jgi:hypothetical protein
MTKIKIIGICIGVVIVITFLLGYFKVVSLESYKYFTPKIAAAERKVFENTQSYVEGKRQELNKYRLEYLRASSESDKKYIQSYITQSFANVDKDYFKGEMSKFLNCMMEGRSYSLGNQFN